MAAFDGKKINHWIIFAKVLQYREFKICIIGIQYIKSCVISFMQIVDVVNMQIYANLIYANIIGKDAIVKSRGDVQANTPFDEIEYFF